MQATSTPNAAALITHQVRNYDAWRADFDAHRVAREEAGILGHHVNRAASDPNTVSVYLPAPTQEALQRFAAASDLRDVMKKAGVVGEPQIVPLTPKEDLTVKQPLAGAIVIHEVKDYGTWKAAFDADKGTREKAGIIGHAVNQRADNAQVVIVYLQAKSQNALKAFTSSSDLKETMQRAGVVGAPTINFVDGMDWATYA